MADEESIEIPVTSFAPTEAETLPLPSYTTRFLTVSAAGPGTRLRIEGLWLENAGFEAGVRVKVHVQRGCLVVVAEPPSIAEPGPRPRARRSWIHDYPNLEPPDPTAFGPTNG